MPLHDEPPKNIKIDLILPNNIVQLWKLVGRYISSRSDEDHSESDFIKLGLLTSLTAYEQYLQDLPRGIYYQARRTNGKIVDFERHSAPEQEPTKIRVRAWLSAGTLYRLSVSQNDAGTETDEFFRRALRYYGLMAYEHSQGGQIQLVENDEITDLRMTQFPTSPNYVLGLSLSMWAQKYASEQPAP